MRSLHFISLGCPKNLVDAEVMLADLEKHGYGIEENPANAEILLVNTCGFIQSAVEEAVDEILAMAAFKEARQEVLLIVCGCMVQRYGDKLREALPEVDLFLAIDDFPHIGSILNQYIAGTQRELVVRSSTYIMDATVPRKLSTPHHRSYLKITEGCDNHCSYCMIPSIRGDLRSRSISDLVTEAQHLEEMGVQELTLIAQDLTAYGSDRKDGATLVKLLESLLVNSTIPWFRLLYLYPTGVSDELLQLMARQSRIVPYLDIPFQHVSDSVLHAMNRPYGTQLLDELVTRIRETVPDCALRTTLMVGFPGETEEDVELMIAMLKKWQLDHVGTFCFQAEEGTPAADYEPIVPEEVQQQRYDLVMETQRSISQTHLQKYVGRVEPVLIEGLSRESDLLLEGRTRFQAPEIDGTVLITSGQVAQGEIVPVRITDAHTYDLVGEVVDDAT
ncbi:30S ribosomal protein S12 methylthiotransferase RimO [Desulfogranum japonicum]|uniref:30S ribosomal protein S12 methylthiotransferase RimO n=1 Tax=Desulfogranum japonicum TaxID=231447 RepID=UPI00040BBADF|nr:30S ribosomal protein S12 methylthiotransferase RimO [Desulfogranum japonicum]